MPLLPYLFGASALWVTLAVTAAALAGGGTAVARLTSRPAPRSGLRQLAFGALAIGAPTSSAT